MDITKYVDNWWPLEYKNCSDGSHFNSRFLSADFTSTKVYILGILVWNPHYAVCSLCLPSYLPSSRIFLFGVPISKTDSFNLVDRQETRKGDKTTDENVFYNTIKMSAQFFQKWLLDQYITQFLFVTSLFPNCLW